VCFLWVFLINGGIQMDNKAFKTLEFDKILEMLSDYALAQRTKQKIMALEPYMSESEVKRKIKETTEAKKIIEATGTPPLASMKEIEKIIALVGMDAMLIPEQLISVAQFLLSCKRMKEYLRKAESLEVELDHEILILGRKK
jgi:DNA mismatch repair protein MutS2